MERAHNATQWTALILRLLIAAAAAALAYTGTGTTPDSTLLSLGVALLVICNGVALLALLIPGLYRQLGWIQAAADWGTAAAVGVIAQESPLSILLAVAAIGVLGIMRSNWPGSAVTGLGTLAGAMAGIVVTHPNGTGALEMYGDTALVAAGVLVFVWLWQSAYVRYGSTSVMGFKQTLLQKEADLATIREGTKAVVQVATSLSTTNYQKILDSALDIGRLALRRNSGTRFVGMVLLVRSVDDKLQIVNGRGLPHYDEDKLFPGRQGIIGKALAEGVPVVGGQGSKDPELIEMVAFARTRSTLAVPLRAQYTNYGVLVFGTTETDAFNVDATDILLAIGTQVTVALQNASLYMNLLAEKERIVRLEANARQSLVRDLHDIPTQTISAVTMRAGILKLLLDRKQFDQLKPELDAVEDMAKQATAEIRHVLFKLRPLALETQGLGVALAQLVEKTRKTFDQNIQLKWDERADHFLTTEAQDALFYLIEEAISNARKYAQAKLIRIDVAIKDDQVIVRVADNGVGFDVESVQAKYVERGSFGMMNMYERVELIGGRLNLQSQPGKGTVVTVAIPFDAASGTGQLSYTFAQMKLSRPSAKSNGGSRAKSRDVLSPE